MKKFYAIVLGLALVLALAGIANAAAIPVVVNGKVTLSGTYDLGASTWTWGSANGAAVATDFTWTAAYGDKATANLDVDLDAVNWIFTMATADYTYKFSEAFSLAFLYNKDLTTAYDAPLLADIKTGDVDAVKAAFTFEGGSAAVYTNLDLTGTIDFQAAASMTFGPAKVGAGFGYDGANVAVGANVVYALNEAIAITGDLGYATDVSFGVKAAYTSESLTADVAFVYAPAMSLTANVGYTAGNLAVGAGLKYDIDGSAILGYKFFVTYKVNDVLDVWAALDNGDYAGDTYDEGFTAGVNLKIDTVNTLKFKYNNDASTFSITLEYAF